MRSVTVVVMGCMRFLSRCDGVMMISKGKIRALGLMAWFIEVGIFGGNGSLVVL